MTNDFTFRNHPKDASTERQTNYEDDFCLRFSMKLPLPSASLRRGTHQPSDSLRMVHQQDIKKQGDRITALRAFDDSSKILAEIASYKHGGPVNRICMDFAIYETQGNTTTPNLAPHHVAHLRNEGYRLNLNGTTLPLFGKPLPQGKILFESWEDVMVCDDAACKICAPNGPRPTYDLPNGSTGGLPFVHRCDVEDGVFKRDRGLRHHGGIPKAMIFEKVQVEFLDGKRRDVAMCDEFCGYCVLGGMPEEEVLDDYDPDDF